MKQAAFQELMPDNFCFGCGSLNHEGLQIKSAWDGEESVCHFEPEAHHAAGPRHFVNGGILATVVDCHSVCTAVANGYRDEGREIGTDPRIWCVTGSMSLKYLKPTPLGVPLELRARVIEFDGRKTRVSCDVFAEGEPCVEGSVLAIRVPLDWLDV